MLCGVPRGCSWLAAAEEATFPMFIGTAALAEAPLTQAMAPEEKKVAAFTCFPGTHPPTSSGIT